jgi:hypothetical protein
MPKELTMHNASLYAEHIMPALRQEWAEYDHRWWPKTQVARDAAPLATPA